MKKVIKSIVSVILSVLICLSAFVTIATAIIKFKISNIEHYVESVIDDKHIDALYEDIRYSVGTVCENLEVDRDTVMTFVNKEEIKSISQNNFRALFHSVLDGTPLSYKRFDNVAMKDEIYRELEAFANEVGIVEEDLNHATDVTYEYIVDEINKSLIYFTQDDVNMVGFVSEVQILDFAINDSFYVMLAVFIVLCILKVLLGRKQSLRTMYNVAFMSWLASACWFFPVLIIKIVDVAAGIILAHGGFKIYVQNLINVVIDGFFYVSLFAFILTTILVITMIVLVIIQIARRTKTSLKTDDTDVTCESEQTA
ncbi:MAG: hypothetical protein IKU25_06095 [Clostridia bacterium]|nr:hypothetical protein [Clostridia bacterium]